MFRLLLVGPLLLAAVPGCASRAIDEQAAKDTSDLRINAAGAFLDSSCHDGSRYAPTCGLISELASTDDFRARFQDRKCAATAEDVCQQRFQAAFDRWLQQRYSAADFAEVARTCAVYPARCAELKQYELRLMDSHNQHVRDEVVRAEADIEDARAAAQRRRREGISEEPL